MSRFPPPPGAGPGRRPVDVEPFGVDRARDPSSPPTLLGAAAMRSLELALAVAENPSATPRILGTIASRWREARPAVCRHPRARWRLLFRLAREHPAAFLANPRAEALVRGEGAAMHAPSPSLVRTLLACEGAPAWLVPALAGHPFAALRAVAAHDPSTPPAHLAELARDRHWAPRRAAAANPALPREELARLAHDPSPRVRAAVAERADAPPAVYALLARDPDPDIRGLVARRAADPLVLGRLADDPEPLVRMYLAENPAAPPGELRKLARDDVYTRLRLAQNPSTGPDVLELLVSLPDGDGWPSGVYAKALAHPNATPAMFERLAGSDDEAVRQCVASRPDAPAHVLAKLAGDTSRKVRWSVAYFASDADLLARLARDPDAGVRRQAAERTRSAAELARAALDPEPRVRETVAQSDHGEPSTLAALARDASPVVRARVAWNRRTPPDALAALARDANEEVAQCALRNDATPLAALVDGLAREPLQGLASAAIRRRVDRAERGPEAGDIERALERGGPPAARAFASCARLPERVAARLEQRPELRAALALATDDPERLRRLAGDPSPAVREAAAQRAAPLGLRDVHARLMYDADEAVRRVVAARATDHVVLRALAHDASGPVRECVARSRHAPPSALEALAADADAAVREAALGNESTPLGALLRARAAGGDDGARALATLARLGHPKGRGGG